MNIEILIYGVFCLMVLLILIIYIIGVIIEERKKIRYYKYTLLYETDWDKYDTMVKKAGKIIFHKKMELFWLTILVGLKRLIKWK